MDFRLMERDDLEKQATELALRYSSLQKRGLALDMTRGKPCPEQLDLSLPLLDCLGSHDYRAADGTDCRNYGGPDGLPEARQLFAELLDVSPAEVIVGGNSSLALMYDVVAGALRSGLPDGDGPWRVQPTVKFLCPCPGYDRHFAICEHLGIEMIPVAMDAGGPNMDRVEELVEADAQIKAIWCVPKYSNPTGVTFSDDVVRRLARMKTAAPDFRVMWDNAYAVHDLTDTSDRLMDLFAACTAAGHANRVFLFGSTSKISFAGAGVAAVAGSTQNLDAVRRDRSIRTIGADKLNQLRHVRFFRDRDGIAVHMKLHAAILRPKFECVQNILESQLGGTNMARWSRPLGGYFVSLDTMDGTAAAVVSRAAEAGVKLTRAGATFPYGRDPRDRNLRLAPTLPSLEEIRSAMEIVTVSVQLVSIERLLAAT